MLVITRREAEEIVIGDPKSPIGRIRIASIMGDRVRVACDFPREIPVHRKEVAQLIASGQTKEQATGATPPEPAAPADTTGP